MKWFRSNIKHGSRLALLALAIQFGLSFGHFHAIAAPAAPGIQSGLTPVDTYANGPQATDAVRQSYQQQSPSTPDSDQQQGDACAICAVMALANAVLFATPPLLLLLPQADEFLYLTTDAEFVHLNSARVDFQPRAPPAS
jgi:hypothetical protein